jgi:hypothetical protein
MTFKEFVHSGVAFPAGSQRLAMFARKCLADEMFPEDPMCWPEIEEYLREGQENRLTISSAFCFWWCYREGQRTH